MSGDSLKNDILTASILRFLQGRSYAPCITNQPVTAATAVAAIAALRLIEEL
jgi:hypothetical protein